MHRLVALLGIGSISFTAIFVRLADTSAITISFFRAVYALPVLGLIWWFTRGDDRRPAAARWLAGGAGVLLAADLLAWHNAIEDIGAGLGTVLVNVQVVFVGLASWLLYRERPTAIALVMTPVILAGVTLISGLGGDGAYGDAPVRGALLGVVAGFFYAAYIVALRASNRSHLAPTPGLLFDATIGLLVGTVVVAPLVGGIDTTWSWPTHRWLLAIALVIQSFGWLLIAYALPRLPVLETSILILAQPMLALIWARLIFDERLSALQWLGVGFVLIGLISVSGRSTAPSDEPSSRAA